MSSRPPPIIINTSEVSNSSILPMRRRYNIPSTNETRRVSLSTIRRKDYNLREFAHPTPNHVIMLSQYEKNRVLDRLQRLGAGMNGRYAIDFRPSSVLMYTPTPAPLQKQSPFFYIKDDSTFVDQYMYDIVRNTLWRISRGKFTLIRLTENDMFVPKYRHVGPRLIRGGGRQTRRK
jgi:hypothetical protein